MIFLLCILISFQDEFEPPQPDIVRRLPFRPLNALFAGSDIWVFEEGFESRPPHAYIYDETGTLIRDFDLPAEGLSRFFGNQYGVVIHDGGSRLMHFDNEGNLVWQRDLAPPDQEMGRFESLLVFIVGDRVLLMDAKSGETVFAYHHKRTLSGWSADEQFLYLADDSGTVTLWDPHKSIRQEWLPKADAPLPHLAKGPQGEWAFVLPGGRLQIWRPNRKLKWKRDFKIDIAAEPIWLESNEHHQLIIATKGRNIYAYNPHGLELSRRLLDNWPERVLRWDDHSCLIVAGQSNKLWWYHAPSATFQAQKIPSAPITIAETDDRVLILFQNGIIQLYQKSI